MSRGAVYKVWICSYCNRPSMRLWPVVLHGKDTEICLACLREAASNGGWVETTEFGGDIEFIGTE